MTRHDMWILALGKHHISASVRMNPSKKASDIPKSTRTEGFVFLKVFRSVLVCLRKTAKLFEEELFQSWPNLPAIVVVRSLSYNQAINHHEQIGKWDSQKLLRLHETWDFGSLPSRITTGKPLLFKNHRFITNRKQFFLSMVIDQLPTFMGGLCW